MPAGATETENPVTALPSAQSANLALVMRVGSLIHTGFATPDDE